MHSFCRVASFCFDMLRTGRAICFACGLLFSVGAVRCGRRSRQRSRRWRRVREAGAFRYADCANGRDGLIQLLLEVSYSFTLCVLEFSIQNKTLSDIGIGQSSTFDLTYEYSNTILLQYKINYTSIV